MKNNNNYLEIAKEKIKIIDQLPPGTKKRKIGKRILIDPCPCCSHKGHFYIYENNNFSSESRCCSGGSIIDYFVQVEKMDIKTAINKVLNEAGFININKKSANEIKALKNKRNIELNNEQERHDRFIRIYNNILKRFKQLKNLENRNSFQTFVMNFLDEISEKTIEYNHKNIEILFKLEKYFLSYLNNEVKMYIQHKEKNSKILEEYKNEYYRN